MSVFILFMRLGFGHIINFGAFDHILFIISLTAVYILPDWKKVLILVTAFTIGHASSLTLSTLSIITVNAAWVELMIAVTILLTSVSNIMVSNGELSVRLQIFKYLGALFFGLIHGLGFSNYLKVLLGMDANILKPLLAFNIGLEIGQILIVFIILVFASLAIKVFHLIKREWMLVLSGAGLGVSVMLIIERFSIF